jgi:hypothetical protein
MVGATRTRAAGARALALPGTRVEASQPGTRVRSQVSPAPEGQMVEELPAATQAEAEVVRAATVVVLAEVGAPA